MREILGVAVLVAIAVGAFFIFTSSSDRGQGKSTTGSTSTAQEALNNTLGLQSAGALEFGPGGVLFVGDSLGGAVYAFEIDDTETLAGSTVNYGNPATFEGVDLIEAIDQKIAALLGTTADQISINDLAVHPPSQQIYLSVHRGLGPDAAPVILRVKDGRLEEVLLDRLRNTKISIGNIPAPQETLEFGQSQRGLTITDIEYWDGEIFVAGVSNEEFASTLRRIRYPFGSSMSTSTIEIWHAAHGQFETRAPIITQVVREIEGVPYLIAAYTCTPLVRIPLSELNNGAHVIGETIGELGFGNAPIDMVVYRDGFDGNDYVLVTNNNRSASRISQANIATVDPMPVDVPGNFGPAGIDQYDMPLTGALHLDLLDEQWAVAIRRNVMEDRIDLQTLPLPFFFDRSEYIVEMNWPGAPDPFGYESQ